MRTCCCLATCSLSFVACFLMASISLYSESERERESVLMAVCLEVLKLFEFPSKKKNLFELKCAISSSFSLVFDFDLRFSLPRRVFLTFPPLFLSCSLLQINNLYFFCLVSQLKKIKIEVSHYGGLEFETSNFRY